MIILKIIISTLLFEINMEPISTLKKVLEYYVFDIKSIQYYKQILILMFLKLLDLFVMWYYRDWKCLEKGHTTLSTKEALILTSFSNIQI